MAELLTPDICVIGAGSGGLTVAAAAASFGVSVVLVEKGKMGGDCLNYGCVPSKALLAAGKQAQAMRKGAKFGIAPAEPQVNFKAVMAHVKSVIAEIAPNDSIERFTALGVRVIQAEARFKDKRTVVAGEHEIRARRFVIATGSSALVPPIPGLSDIEYLTNETVFEQEKLPGQMVIIGGGPIGMEMAQAHRRLGAEVTVIEAFAALGKDDPETASVIISALQGEGIAILENTKVVSVEKRGKTGVRVNVEGPAGAAHVDGTRLLVAAGRAPNVNGLDLEKAGIEYDRRGIRIRPNLRTTNSRVYAIGDVAGSLQFTHMAGYHAGLVVRSILFRLPVKENRAIIPWATFTEPELAQVGLSEPEAKKSGMPFKILRWPFSENDRAIAEHKSDGMIKILTTPEGKILGVSIAGHGAGEMINMWALAISEGLGVRDIAYYVAPYPTMGEAGKRAAISYFAPLAKSPRLRRLIGFLRRFG
jgi:pyruvate/2-oxoglutarate dehydrogenase complex dihydrolipoamide dehydrogenase (E3) component